MAKLGFSDRKTVAPKNIQEMVEFLSVMMSAAINNEVELDNARVSLTAASRIIEALQADTRMKAVAMASNRSITKGGGFALIDTSSKFVSE